MKICVVGGSGFIGTAFCRRLYKQKIPFEIIDLKKSLSFPKHSVVADIRDIDQLRVAITGNVIVNLAAVHRDDVQDSRLYYDTNVKGTRNICRLASVRGIKRIVFTSTVAVYGFAPVGTTESGNIKPFNHYGKSKFEGEEVLRNWRKQDPQHNALIIIRPTVVFGEGNRGNVFNLFRQIAAGKFVMIGAGTNTKSMAYVENVAAFLQYAALGSEHDLVVNYVDDPNYDMNKLISIVRGTLFGKPKVGLRLPFAAALIIGWGFDALAKALGKSFPVSSIRVRKFCANTSFSSESRKQIPFEPPFTLDDGLRRTLEAEFLSPDPNREVFFTE